MRMLMRVTIPVAAGNKSIQDGTLPQVMNTFIEQMKPESAYFTAQNGQRTGFFVFDLQDLTMIPTICEPFFIALDAQIELSPAMNVDEMRTGVAKAMQGNGQRAGKKTPVMQAQPK